METVCFTCIPKHIWNSVFFFLFLYTLVGVLLLTCNSQKGCVCLPKKKKKKTLVSAYLVISRQKKYMRTTTTGDADGQNLPVIIIRSVVVVYILWILFQTRDLTERKTYMIIISSIGGRYSFNVKANFDSTFSSSHETDSTFSFSISLAIN